LHARFRVIAVLGHPYSFLNLGSVSAWFYYFNTTLSQPLCRLLYLKVIVNLGNQGVSQLEKLRNQGVSQLEKLKRSEISQNQAARPL